MSGKYPKAIGPYSAYRVLGSTIYVSGQLPIDPNTGEFVSDDVKEQTKRSLENILAILEENGVGMESVVKTTVFLSDIGYFADMNSIYSMYFKEPYPARSAFAVKDLPKGAKVEIEVVAHKG